MSYRSTARHVGIIHQTRISHTSIANWFTKYVQLRKEYVDRLIPEFQEVWSVDEMMINVKNTEPTGMGFYSWMLSIISPQEGNYTSNVPVIYPDLLESVIGCRLDDIIQ